MFVTKPRAFFDYALKSHFSVPSFNVCNLETARGVVLAAEAEDAPVMLQSYFGDLYYGGLSVFPQMLRNLAEQARVPVLVHQDHPDKDDLILQTLRAGYYSVMYDGGTLPLEKNIAGAARIVKIAHPIGAVVEAELGLFGGGEGHGDDIELASVEGSKRLVEETGIDTLAPAVGSVHGGDSRLDLKLLESIAKSVNVPLVLHGGSGIHPDDLKAARQMNVVKVNVGADLFRAVMSGLALATTDKPRPEEPVHHHAFRLATEKVTELARKKLNLMAANTHAPGMLQHLNGLKVDIAPINEAKTVA